MLLKINFIVPRILCTACLVALLSGCTSMSQYPPTSDQSTSSNADGEPAFRVDGTISEPLPKMEVVQSGHRTQTIDLIHDDVDLMQRILNGFSMPDINSDLVLYHQQRYQNSPDYLRRLIERARPYLYHIVEELDRRGMPMELVFLPMVESAYDPMAYSRAKALGLWQFIPSTGKRFNLDQDWWQDQRRDIVASTAAALDYLQIIYEMHGDWHLALASYNWGEGSVARAISKNAALGMPTDYLSLTMPDETKNYIPKLQALKNIFSKPSLMAELGIPAIANSPYFMTVTKDTPIDVKVAARLAEMPVKEFVALNPAYNRPVIKSDTPMVIPASQLSTFMSNLEAHKEKNKPLSAWQTYTLRPEDRLEKVALRFGMTVANLKAINGIQEHVGVKPGQTLLVPGKVTSADYLKMMEPLPEQPRYLGLNDGQMIMIVYEVRKNDTLYGIAKHHGVSVADLKYINQLHSNAIKPGMRLSINVKQANRSQTNRSAGGSSKQQAAKSRQRSGKATKTASRRTRK